jgi:DNA repair exonuclease SbcCD ATPase subunit
MLVDLGVCGTYLDRFDRAFSKIEFPDGPEVNTAVCEDKYSVFDWDWANSVMLTRDAQREWNAHGSVDNPEVAAIYAERDTLRNERREKIRDWQQKHGIATDYPPYDTPDDARREYDELVASYENKINEVEQRVSKRRAAYFGTLMEDPHNYSSSFNAALESEVRRVERREREALQEAEAAVNQAKSRIVEANDTIEDAKRRITNAKRRITDWTARLPELEATLVEARADYARKQLVRQEAAVAEQQAKLDELRRQIAEAETTEPVTAEAAS